MADSACAPAGLAPRELRERFRAGELVRPTSGLAPGFVQANLVILPRALAFDFLLFCQRNPKPCPLLEVVEAGSAEPQGDGARRRPADRRAQVPGLPRTACWPTNRWTWRGCGATTSCRS